MSPIFRWILGFFFCLDVLCILQQNTFCLEAPGLLWKALAWLVVESGPFGTPFLTPPVYVEQVYVFLSFPSQETPLRVVYSVMDGSSSSTSTAGSCSPWSCHGQQLTWAQGLQLSWPYPKGPNLEKIQDRLKFSISLENFNLAWKFQSWPPEFPTKKIGVWWVARLKMSSLLENFKILKIFKIWALRVVYRGGYLQIPFSESQNTLSYWIGRSEILNSALQGTPMRRGELVPQNGHSSGARAGGQKGGVVGLKCYFQVSSF